MCERNNKFFSKYDAKNILITRNVKPFVDLCFYRVNNACETDYKTMAAPVRLLECLALLTAVEERHSCVTVKMQQLIMRDYTVLMVQ